MYTFAITCTPMEGVFSATQIISVYPCYAIVNYMDEPLYLCQHGDRIISYGNDDLFSIDPKSCLGLHKLNSNRTTSMKFRSQSSTWSVGAVDINEIGSTILILPREKDDGNLIVAHIEVKLSPPDVNSYITVIVWQSIISFQPQAMNLKSKSSSFPALSIKNDSDFPVIIQQAGIDFASCKVFGKSVEQSKFDLCVPPGKWLPYGWTDQSIGTILNLSVGTTSAHSTFLCSIDFLQIGVISTFDALSQKVNMIVKIFSSGKVLHLFKKKANNKVSDSNYLGAVSKKGHRKSIKAPQQEELVFKLYCNSIGLSLISERYQRRELFSLYIDKVNLVVTQKNGPETSNPSTLVQLQITDIQIDNYSESVVYPVLLNSFNSEEKKYHSKYKTKDDPPFFHLSSFSIIPRGQKAPVIKYFAFKILEIKLSIDSSSILIYLSDLHDDFFPDSSLLKLTNQSAIESYIASFNSELITTLKERNYADVEKTFESAQVTKIYVESLVIHPIKINLTFTPTNYSRSSSNESSVILKYPWIKIIQNITAVDEFEVKINSFIVENAMDSIESLGTRILSKVVRDLQMHLVQIAGSLLISLSLIGKPAGLVKNIGGGVQDFFYEPYMGIINQNPQEFVMGVGKGTGSLLTNVVSGVLSTTAISVGSVTNILASGATIIAGDEKFSNSRDEKLRSTKAANGGMISGLKAGGENIVSGFASGITGLVT